jgi:hypothetical protein
MVHFHDNSLDANARGRTLGFVLALQYFVSGNPEFYYCHFGLQEDRKHFFVPSPIIQPFS